MSTFITTLFMLVASTIGSAFYSHFNKTDKWLPLLKEADWKFAFKVGGAAAVLTLLIAFVTDL